ncbi:MAG TPA: hypothetical protein VEX41_07005 [Candidatus Eisenbacteria bacterium]|nr:hypothetical protein [Candidatus Eisenbacteria bacterium]
MTTSRDFDRIATAWLAEGPSELADRVLDDALAEVHLTHQRRGRFAPWRYPPMNAFSRVAAAVLVAALALGGAVYLLGRSTPSVGGPTAPPSVSPSPPPAPPTQLPASALVPFTSKAYGYTMSIPAGWGVRAATRTLNGTEAPWDYSDAVDNDAVDNIAPGDLDTAGVPLGTVLVGASGLPPDTTLASWTSGTAIAICSTPTAQRDITLDGEPAIVSTFATCHNLFHQWATVLHGGWAWHIVWLNYQGSEGADVVFFEQILATFRFGEVPAASAATASPAPS